MKSPPLEVWFTGSLVGASVSTAICRGPGTAALRLGLGAGACALAAPGVSAAAPTRPAPLRKLRRSELGKLRRLDMHSSHQLRLTRARAAAGARSDAESRVPTGIRQGDAHICDSTRRLRARRSSPRAQAYNHAFNPEISIALNCDTC